MSLIERYLLEVGRHLPRKNRADILIELRSTLADTLEDRAAGEPTEADIVRVLEEFGHPKKVAASYYPEGQYLISPALFPLFRLVVGITLAAVVGAQILGLGVAAIFAEDQISLLDAVFGVLNSIPAVFGWVVLVFAILQWYDVRPDLEEEKFDPHSLPQITTVEPVKVGERIFGIVAGVLVLVVLGIFGDRIGFYSTIGGQFFANPVIQPYIPWISLSILFGITLDIVLLWQGRWQPVTRVAKILANLFSAAILYLLVQAHTAWLAARGVSGFFDALTGLADDITNGGQLIGMQAFRMAFLVALVVLAVDTAVMLFRLVGARLRQDALVLKKA